MREGKRGALSGRVIEWEREETMTVMHRPGLEKTDGEGNADHAKDPGRLSRRGNKKEVNKCSQHMEDPEGNALHNSSGHRGKV